MKLSRTETYKAKPDFRELHDYIATASMLPEGKRRQLYEYAIYASFLPEGIVAEAGVWAGGSLYILASVIQDSEIYGFDSWKGLPERSVEDFDNDLCEVYKDVQDAMTAGWGVCSPPADLFSKFGDRVKLIPGWFEDTLIAVSDKRFRLVHIDCDRYASCKVCLEFFYPRMIGGGIIVVDDYLFLPTPGVTRAVDEFVADKPGEFRYNVSDGLYLIMGDQKS